MVASSERGSQYDRFRERLMFPILDRRGRVIAFGGRILASAPTAPEDQAAGSAVLSSAQGAPPKYLNSPETPLFHKGRELFALWQVKQANPSLARIVVVEGYMDVIALHQAGLPIAVATLGTATTPEHAEVLFRAAPDVVFCFDGDRAGRAAAVEGAGIGAAAPARRSPGVFPVPARRRGPGFAGAQGRQGRLRETPARGDAAVGLFLRRAVARRGDGQPRRPRAAGPSGRDRCWRSCPMARSAT